ncbi:MAG: TIM-barrel domain-containing protein [Ginsengibacter sp.]
MRKFSKHFFNCVTFILIINICSAQIKSFKKTDFGVSFKLDKGMMNLYLFTNDLVEVKYTVLDEMPEKKSLVVLPVKSYLKNFTLNENKDNILINTSRLKIRIDKKNNAITYLNTSNQVILSEADNNGKQMRDTTIVDINTFACATSFQSPRDEALFGLGCHPEDSLSINYKGRNQDMAIKYLTGAIPVLLSTRGYGLLWDNYAESKFYGDEKNNSQFTYVSESGKMVDYYFFYGPSFDHIMDLYRSLTGVAPMYPKWAFGLFQSQDRYKTQKEVLSVKDNYRKNHIPVDAIVQDWFYWSPLPIGSHVMNPERYPDPKAMVDELHKAHIHAMISIWPCFGKGTQDFNQLKNAGYLSSVTWDNFFVHSIDTYYDAHNPAAREMYWDQARDSLIKRYGWDAWWVDQCEPDTKDPNDRKRAVFYTGQGTDYFNSYSLEHTKGIYNKWRRDIPKKRIFLLARQAFAGQQRNASTLWSSDITTTFASFKNQIPQAINACISGIPYWTSDIGGYLSRVSPEGVPDWSRADYRELFTRWFQFGAFSPIFRIHGKGERALFSDNWDAHTKKILLKYDDLRYRLLPYIYSLSSEVTRNNYTIMRSLAFDFRNDSKVYNIPDQYLFGPAFLVNPVTQQLYSGVDSNKLGTTRKVYLPKNANWIDFWTGKKLKGGQTIDADAPIETMPLFVREGSIIPMGPVMEYATEKPADNIELRIYPGADGHFTLYEDANNTYNYEKGEFATFNFTWNDKTKELNISERKGSFPGMLKTRIFTVVLVGENKGTGVKQSTKTDKIISYNGKALKVKL